jgi:hypothetical protein
MKFREKKAFSFSASTCLGGIPDEHLVEETLELGGHLLVLQLGRRHVSDTAHCLHNNKFYGRQKRTGKREQFKKNSCFDVLVG